MSWQSEKPHGWDQARNVSRDFPSNHVDQQFQAREVGGKVWIERVQFGWLYQYQEVA